MFKTLRRRSLLPILASFAALALGLGLPRTALALDEVRLDPAHVGCVTVPLRGGAQRCDVLVDGLQVHEGRETGVAESNGDCVKCRSVVARASSLGREIVMLRGFKDGEALDWNNDDFFTVAGDENACR